MAPPPSAAPDRPDVFLSYAREDTGFAEGRLARELTARGKDVWIDVDDIRGGASDWRASVWAGIEAATVLVFVLTPDSLRSEVCGEELAHAADLNKRILPVLHRPVDGMAVPPALERPNWVVARAEDDLAGSVDALVEALELDEPWIELHARLTQRTGEWLRNDRDGSYLLRGSDLRRAESWLDDQASHREKPTADQVTYITASRRAAARRQRSLLGGVALALLVTIVLALAAVSQWRTAVSRQKTAEAQALAAQALASLSRDPESSLDRALQAVQKRPKEPEALFALRHVVSLVGWTSLLAPPREDRKPVDDVEFSADGRRVVTGGTDGSVALWDARSGRRLAVVHHPGAVHTVQFSPDGRRVLTASKGGVARILDGSTLTTLHELDTHTTDAWAATWGAGGRRIVTASARGGEIWDGTTGALRVRLPIPTDSEFRGTIRMSLDGRRVVTPGSGADAKLWNAATGGLVRDLAGCKGEEGVAFSLLSANGRTVVVFYDSGAFRVWRDGRPARCHRGVEMRDEALSQDGRRVLRADLDGAVEVWDTRSGKRIARLPAGGTLASAQFDRTGRTVVTGADNGVGRVWQLGPTRRVAVLRGHTNGVLRARFSPDGTVVATVSDDGTARLWPARPSVPDDPSWQHAQSVSFGPDSRHVLLVDGERRAIWDTQRGTVVRLQGGGVILPYAASWPCGRAAGCSPWRPDGGEVAGVDAAGGAVLWNPRTGRIEKHLGPETGTVVEAAFSPDGRRVAVVDANRRTARIWNAETGSPTGETIGGAAELNSVQFVPGSPLLLTVDAHGTARLVRPAARPAVGRLLPGTAQPSTALASDDGRFVVLGERDGKLRVVPVAGGPVRAGDASGRFINALAVAPGGTAIATGGNEGTAATWDPTQPKLSSMALSAPGGQVSGLSFSPDSRIVLVTAKATARLWDRTLPRIVVQLPQVPDVRGEISPDGSRLVIAGRTRVEMRPCDACASLDELERRARSLLPPG